MAKGFSFEEALQPPEKKEPAGFSFEDALVKPTERTWGEALVTDPITSLLSGAGSMIGSPGQLKQLITGEKPSEEKPKGTIESLAQTLLPFGTDYEKMPEKVLQKLTPTAPSVEGVTGSVLSPFKGLQPVGEELKAFGEKNKSAGLKAREQARNTAISQQEGFLPELTTAVGETVKDPALLSNFIFEQIPNFAGTLGGGAITKQMVKSFFKDATEKTLGKVGVTGAVLTGGAMQAGDIGSETYQMIYDRLIKEGTPEDQAHQIALEKGRMAAAQAGAISVASSFIPGGKALEKRFLTQAGKKAGFPGFVPAVGNVVGEATQEGVEEGGGRLVSNLQAQQVFPEIDPMKGVGAATGLGALGGGMFGGIANLPSALSRAPQEPPPVPPSGAAPSAEAVPSGGPATPPPSAPSAVPTQVKPLEQEIDQTEARLAELQNEFEQINQMYATATPEQFAELNAVQGRIKSEMNQLIAESTSPAVAKEETLATLPNNVPLIKVPEGEQAKTPKVEEPTKIAAVKREKKVELKGKTEKPQFAEDDAGEKLTYPMFVGMANKGYQLHSFDNPRTYENKGGQKYRTLEKDGVRIALEPKQVLFTDPKKPYQQPQLGIGNENDVAFHFLGVDPELRREGRASEALDDLIHVADINDYTLYGEPAQLEKESINKQQLLDLYRKYGFNPTDESGKVIVRNPGALPKRSKAENVPVIAEGETVDSSDPEVLKKYKEIIKTYEPESGHSYEDSFLEAINKDIRSKEEVIKAPPFKKGWTSQAKIEVAPFNGGWVGGSMFMSNTGGYASGASIWDEVFPTKQEAINNQIDIMRKSATTYADKKALAWLDSIDPRQTKEGKIEANKARQAAKKTTPKERVIDFTKKGTLRISSPTEEELAKKLSDYLGGTKISIAGEQVYNSKQMLPHYKVRKESGRYRLYELPTVEVGKENLKKTSQAEINKERQAEKKAKAEKAKQPVDTSAVNDLIEGKIKKVLGWTIYKRKEDPDFWYVQSPENHAENRIGSGDDVSTNLDTARARIEQHINDAEYEARKAAEKPAEKKVEVKAEEPAKKPSTALVPKLDESWAERRKEVITEKPSSMDQEVFDRYKELQNGDLAFTKVSFTGAQALAKANAANKERKKVYDKAVQEFLNNPITAKAPTKNQPKLDASTVSGTFPPPIVKNIKPAKTLEEQKKALLTIAAPKDEARKMLQGILVEPNRMVVTDGHRLAMYETPTGVTEKVILDKDGKVIDSQYPPYERILDTTATSYGMVNAVGLGNYARGTRNAWKYVSADKNAPFSIQLKNGDKPIPFNARYIEDMTNVFRQFGYDGFEISYNDNGKLIAKSPDGKLTQIVMGIRDLSWLFQPFNVKENKPGSMRADNVIDVQATEITEEQIMLLSDETSKLSKKELETLEAHYGMSSDSDNFFKLLREDVIKYVNKGADAVDAAIRDIIKKLQSGVLAVAMVFNPAYMSQQSAVVYPTTTVTQQVTAQVPETAKDMSDSAKKAYSVLFPAINPQAENKLFTIVDKPTSKVYVFNPDGSLLVKDNVVLGMAMGDTYVGGTDFKGNRVTPAGLLKVKAEKGSATYDGKTIYTVGNVQEGWNTAFMHTVYLKESDAEARKQALATGEKTRLSHGCVNASPEVMAKIEEGNRMDGSHVFVVPDNQAMTDDYIANNVSNEDLTRETIAPVTKTTQVPEKPSKPQMVAREEQAVEQKTQAQINRDRQQAKLAKTEPTEGTFYNNFDPDFTEAQYDGLVDDVRKEKIKELAANSRQITKTVKRIADMGSDLTSQYQLNRLREVDKGLTAEIDNLKQPKNFSEDFVSKALGEKAENRRNPFQGLSPEATAVVEALYKKFPAILDGLKLSVRATERPGVTGSFEPIERMVTVYKHGIAAIFGKAGEKQARTMRHEITHSLEQMMTPEVKKVLVNAWATAFGKAIEANKDEAHQNYFQAVLDFIENPNESTYRKATNLLPNYNMYQFISPSEFWAVNAEPMLAAKLGGAWTKFANAVKGLWEAIKSVFGFDNRYAVHREFNRIMAGDQKRINKQMLVDYLNQNGVTGKFINNIEEDLKLIDDLNLPEVPDNDPKTFKDLVIGNYQRSKKFAEDLQKQPGQKFTDGLTNTYETGTMARIQAANYAAGIEARDFAKYKGQVRTADKLAIASLAVKNNLHAAMIAARVITQGALVYNKEVLQFIAAKSDKSIANVVGLQKKLRKEMGKKVADKIINAFFTAKRSRSIQNSYFDRSNKVRELQDKLISTVDPEAQRKVYKDLFDAQKDLRNIIVAYQKIPLQFRSLDEDGNSTYETILDENDKETKIPILNDEAIDRAISASKRHPELQQMMDNWTAVNHNILDNMFLAGRINAKQLESLKAIKDYSPWYRVMNDDEDVYDSSKIQMNTAGVKHFRPGEVDRNMDNVVDGMIHNVTAMTRGLIRNYANVRIAQEYGTRYEEGKKKGKLMVFASEGKDATGLRLPVYMAGSRVIIKVEDDLVSSAVLGMAMGPVNYPFKKVLGAASNLFRRSITFSGFFQIKQVFYDAPTAAWISGVRRPDLLFAHCFTGFVKALNPASSNPTIELIKNAGFGGLQSHHRTAKGEMNLDLGILDHNHFAQAMKAIDMVGDASDLSQRIPTFDRVFKETNDKALALMMAADVIDFNKHGLHPLANFLRSSVTFLQAYATQADVFAMAMVGGNIKGKERGEAAKNFYYTGLAMASIMVGYTLLCCADDDYFELDDQTKARNLYIPFSKKTFGHHVLIPLHSTAATFFKVMPELAVNYIFTKGTKNEMDKTRLGKAAGQAMIDSLFGPTPIPTGVKPFVEIGLNHNFFTGSTVTPKGMEGLKEAQQYNASTSELGKFFSALTTIPFTSEEGEKYTEGKRLLNPIEADHLMRSIGGSVATMAMYGTNMMFSENRVAPEARENPLTAGILGKEVPRRNEDLFYDLKERSDREYKTYMDLIKTERFDDADRMYKANEKLIDAHGYVTDIDNALKAINAEIRRIGRVEDKNYSPQEKRKDINEFQQDKMDILDDIIDIRKEAGL